MSSLEAPVRAPSAHKSPVGAAPLRDAAPAARESGAAPLRDAAPAARESYFGAAPLRDADASLVSQPEVLNASLVSQPEVLYASLVTQPEVLASSSADIWGALRLAADLYDGVLAQGLWQPVWLSLLTTVPAFRSWYKTHPFKRQATPAASQAYTRSWVLEMLVAVSAPGDESGGGGSSSGSRAEQIAAAMQGASSLPPLVALLNALA